MVTITRFLDKKTRDRINRDRDRFEKAFNLPKGTIEAVEKKQSSRRSRSSSGGSSGSSGTNIPKIILPITTDIKDRTSLSSIALQEKVRKQLEKEKKFVEEQNRKRLLESIAEKRRRAEFIRTAQSIAPNPDELKREQQIKRGINSLERRITNIQNKPHISFNDRKFLIQLKLKIEMLKKDLKRGITTGTFTAAPTRGGVGNIINNLNELKNQKSTSSTRSKQKSLTNELKLIGLTVVTTTIAGVEGFIALPSSLIKVVRNPRLLLKIPSAIERGGRNFGQLIRTSPTEAFAKIGTEIFLLKGTGKVFEVTGKLASNTAARLSPFYRKVDKGLIIIRKTPEEIFKVRGSERFLSRRVRQPSIKRPFTSLSDLFSGRKPGQFARFQKDAGVSFKLGKLIDVSRPLSEQLKFEGRTVTAVSVQTDALITLIRKRKIIIKKPLLNEANLTPLTKRLLKKFDDGVITKSEFVKLNDRVLAETGKSILERSTYFDPVGTVRFTRIGESPRTATLSDILEGNFKFIGDKPQILFIENAELEKLPKYLSDIKRKLKQNKQLTKSETTRLVEWQVKNDGFLKIIGDTKYKGGVELEVTIAPKETLKVVRKAGSTLIKVKNKAGKTRTVKVDIFQVEIFKPSTKLQKIIDDAFGGFLSTKKVKQLERLLSKKTNSKIKLKLKKKLRSLESKLRERKVKKIKSKKNIEDDINSIKKSKGRRRRPKENRPLLRPTRVIAFTRKIKSRPKIKRVSITTKPRPIRITRPRPLRTLSTKVRPPRPSRTTSTVPRTTSPRPSRPISPRTPRTIPPVIPKTGKPKVLPRFKRRRTKKRKIITKAYNVYAKPIKTVRGKKTRRLLKVNKVPLTKNTARDLRNYVTDTSLSRTAKIKPIKGKPKKSRLKVPKGYARKTANKFRRYRIVKGKRKLLPKGKVIERRKRLLDTKGEKRRITLRKRIKQITKQKITGNVKKTHKKRSISPQSKRKKRLSKSNVRKRKKT